jgi:hypothetical protein
LHSCPLGASQAVMWCHHVAQLPDHIAFNGIPPASDVCIAQPVTVIERLSDRLSATGICNAVKDRSVFSGRGLSCTGVQIL